MDLPLLDLKALNAPMQAAIDAALMRVAHSGRYVLGPEVEAFEAEWAAYCHQDYCVGVGNCLDALRLILMGYGIGPGDEVIVPSNTYIATWLAVSLVGAKPVPVEPDSDTYVIDAGKIEAAITPKTRAIIAVHLYGCPCDMVEIDYIAEHNGLLLMEDAAQAHGGYGRNGPRGDAAAFSFYPSKNLGGLGDGGAIVTWDAKLAERIRRLRNYGGVGRVDHTVRGINSRLDEIQAAVLRAKLPFLPALNEGRAQRAMEYLRCLSSAEVTLPLHLSGHVWHQFVIRSRARDVLQRELANRGIEAHVHYPVPPHLEGAYQDLGFGPGSFPIAERLANEVLSLPIGNAVDVAGIARAVAQAAAEIGEPVHA